MQPEMDHLDALEAQSIYIFREAFARLNKLALLWEGEDGSQRTYSYFKLWKEVNRFANPDDRFLVEREGPAVVRACHRILGDLHEAEDAGIERDRKIRQRAQDAITMDQQLAAVGRDQALKGWFDALPNADLSALHYQGGAAWRARIAGSAATSWSCSGCSPC